MGAFTCFQEDEPMTVLKRQCITDATGNPLGVILPLEEFELVAETLAQRLTSQRTEVKLQRMEIAAHDPLFLADLAEMMADCSHVDTEGWEQEP
jgi:hypothetical protein